MGQRERDACRWLREKTAAPDVRFTRIENLVGNGMADGNICVAGVESWIEVKAPIEPVRPTSIVFKNNHNFNQDQKNFALAQRKAGGNCWAFISTNFRRLLVPGSYIEYMNKMTMQEIVDAAVWVCNVGETNKDKVTAQLRHWLKNPTPNGIYVTPHAL